MTRPEKSLQLLVKNPNSSLHNYFNPTNRLHLLNWMKRTQALLRSNLVGLIQSK